MHRASLVLPDRRSPRILGPLQARRSDKFKRLRACSERVGRTEKSPEPNAQWVPGLLVSDSLKLKIRCAAGCPIEFQLNKFYLSHCVHLLCACRCRFGLPESSHVLPNCMGQFQTSIPEVPNPPTLYVRR